MRIKRVTHSLVFGSVIVKRVLSSPGMENKRNMVEWASHLDTLIMKVHAICNSSHVYVAHFGTISILPTLTFHPSLLVYDPAFDHTISNSLANDVLSIF